QNRSAGPLRPCGEVQPAAADRGGARVARGVAGLVCLSAPGRLVDGERRRTKIVATIGPRTNSHELVRMLAEAGMDAVRVNLSHGTQEEHARTAGFTRTVQAELGRPLALIADPQRPHL